MKIALVQCPCFSVEMPSLGIAYLCSALKNEGYEVKVFDYNIRFYNSYKNKYAEFWKRENDTFWYSEQAFLEKLEFNSWIDICVSNILEFNPDVIGFSVYATSVYFSLKIVKRIKEKDKSKIIIFGGPECLRENPETFLNDSVDFVVRGPGETSLIKILKALNSASILNGCTGLVFKSGRKIVQITERNLDNLLLPDFSLFERDKYFYPYMLPMITSAGCIKKCAYCVDTWYEPKYIYRNPRNILAEIIYLIDKYNIKSIQFNDLLLNGNLSALEEMCNLMVEHKITYISWSGNAVIRSMDEKLLRKMYMAGCRGLTFGVESCSQRVLNLMKKKVKVIDISRVIKTTAKVGIKVTLNWLLGFPGEERKDLIVNMKFILKHREYIFSSGGVNILAINYPSIIAQESEKLNIRLVNNNAFNWVYRDNDLKERLHRQKVFVGFLEELELLSSYNKIKEDNFVSRLSFFKRRKLLQKYQDELYRDKKE